jgi:hypothetical protein
MYLVKKVAYIYNLADKHHVLCSLSPKKILLEVSWNSCTAAYVRLSLSSDTSEVSGKLS